MNPAPVFFVLAACFLSPARLLADDVDAIQSVIQSLNHPQNLTSLFTAKADMGDFDRLLKTVFADGDRPWSEVTTPRITATSVQFHSPQFAFVEGVKSQYGSMIPPRKVSIFFVLKKQGEVWKIAYLKMNSDFRLIPFLPALAFKNHRFIDTHAEISQAKSVNFSCKSSFPQNFTRQTVFL